MRQRSQPAARRSRIWFVSELFWPEETSTGYFVTRIAEDAAGAHDVHALCSQPTYAARGVVAPRREMRNGIHIERMRSTTLSKDVLLHRVVNLVTFSISVFVCALLRLRPGDIVVAVTNPPTVPYLVRAAAALRRARFILLVHDVYPDVLVATGVARSDAVHVRILDAVSRWLYRSAERVIVLGRDMDALVRRKLAATGPAPLVIPNWGDVDVVRPDDTARSVSRNELGLDSTFVIGYVGNIGRTHDLETLVDVADLLRHDDRFRFLFVGAGARREWLVAETAARGLANVRIPGPCGPDELCGVLNAVDVAVLSFRRGMAGISVPSRVYNMMAAGRPLLAIVDDGSEIARLVHEERMGWVSRPEDPAAAAELLRALACAPAELTRAGRNGRAAAVRSYSRQAVTQRWLRLFHEMTAASFAAAEDASGP
jgi:colanic acid biosynthesis glycosyl transferase WcaI